MADWGRKLVALVSALVILMAVVVLPGCKKSQTQKPVDPNKTAAPTTTK